MMLLEVSTKVRGVACGDASAACREGRGDCGYHGPQWRHLDGPHGREAEAHL